MSDHRDDLESFAVAPGYESEGKFWAPPTRLTAEDAVRRYLAAWNEDDPSRRLALLEDACTSDVRYVDPEGDVTGLDALSGVIAAFRAEHPDHALRLASEADAHHDQLRFAWLVERSDGSTFATGLDACVRAADGRLSSIAGFFGELTNLDPGTRGKGDFDDTERLEP